MKILVFGNPYLKEDSLAAEIAKELELENVEWRVTDNLNDLLEEDYSAILDVAYGIPRVVILNDLKKLREHRLVSLHDYDVAYFLKLMKAMGKIYRVKIIAIPVGYDKRKASDEIKVLIKDIMNNRSDS